MKRNESLFITLSLTVLLIVLQYLIQGGWWWFIIPAFFVGLMLPPKRVKGRGFIIGFVAGALSWIMPHLYFQMVFPEELFPQIAALIGLPSWVLVIGLGVISGILSGLAFTSGKLLRTGREQPKLDLE